VQLGIILDTITTRIRYKNGLKTYNYKDSI